ncbi:MAG: LEA type 2 family protein [Candidatus Thiodiazotropha sp. (ex Lucinoma annulata)]|nr:LEA type 2 family protein [Candidatus Thiodiazotropha sp. (ex Lucinoma borealis)]MCU7855038.1 LEA type 2 family protein [Candidatus Thiodiazotropha sp. (ex Lucinoma borealis)]MCU7867549.1 LEA type 2 family protein [Candidatus Thiodiazotropha sp. (ex Lucinoma borealis)]MCU7883657.1 LEA type 2 family protein [Candidatus Thiodiazotropha sp. (ex Lucinoma annulata)]
MTSLDFDGVELAFDVNVTNPNPVGIDLAGLDYDLKLLGNSFVKGEQPMALSVAANGTSQIELPMRLGFRQLMSSYQKLQHASQAAYQLDLGLGFNIPVLGKMKLPVSYQGEFPIPKIPDIKVKNLDIQKLTLNNAKLLLQIEVDNPNNFSLLLDQLNYNLKLNGFNVGNGLLSQSVAIKQDGRGVINLPLSVNIMQAGMGLYSALLGNDGLKYELNGSMAATSSNSILSDIKIPLNEQGVIEMK